MPLVPLLRGNRKGSELAVEAGGDLWLTKPVRRSRLYKCLHALIHQPEASVSRESLPADVDTVLAQGRPSSHAFQGRILVAEDNPINSTNCLEIANPNPVPPYLRVVVESA